MKTTAFVLGLAVAGLAASVTPPLVAVAEAAGANLGDLSSFRTIVADTLALVDAGKLDQARARIKEFETAWDDAEPSLKPRAAAVWHRVDKAADGAYEPLRATPIDAAAAKAAVTTLLTEVEQASAKR